MSSQIRLSHDADLQVDLLVADRLTHTFSTHAHPELLIAAFAEGAEVFHAAGKSWTASAGDLLVVPPGLAQDGAAASPKGYSYRACYVPRSTLERTIEGVTIEGLPAEPLILRGSDLGERAFRNLEALGAGDLSALERQESLTSLLADVLNAVCGEHDATRHAVPRAAMRVREFLHEHFAAQLKAADLAAVAGVSESRLAHVFSAAYKCSPGVYQMALRLAEARRLIGAGCELAGIAAQLGFADQAHLTRRFKAAFGVTPGRFR